MQPAKAGAGIERDIGEPILLDQIDDNIRLLSLFGFLDVGIALLRIAHSGCLLRLNTCLSCVRDRVKAQFSSTGSPRTGSTARELN